MKDSTIIKFCLIIFLIGILALILISNSIENTKNIAVIKKVNSNNKYLNLTIQTQKGLFQLLAYTKAPLPIREGDYIQIKGTIKQDIITPHEIKKLKILT